MSCIPINDFSLISLCDATKAGKLYSIVPDDGSGDFDVARNSTATYLGADGLIKTAAINEPRIEFNPDGSYKGLLVEPQRTNLVFPSDVATTQTRTVTAAAHTLSFYGTGQVVLSGVATGTLTGTGANERVTLTFTPTAGSLVLTVTGSVTLWQLEAAPTASSYIPTVASTVTRVADVVSKTGISSLIGQTEGTIFLEFDFTNISGIQVLFSIHDSASNKRVEIWANNSILNGFIGGSVNITIGTLSISNGRHKVALAYKQSGDQAFYIDGVQIGTSATAYTIAALTALSYDFFGGGLHPAVRVRQTALSKTRLSNAQLEALTS